MAYEVRENSGSLFRNQKRTEENQPNATGRALIGGVMYWVSSWTKTQQSGDKWQSLSFKPVDEQKREPEKKETMKARPGFDDGFEDDIPW